MKNPTITIKLGDTKRCDCHTCLAEFEVTNEPKLNEMEPRLRERERDLTTREVTSCPFCGSNEITTEEME